MTHKSCDQQNPSLCTITGFDDKDANVRSESLRLCGEAAAQLWRQAEGAAAATDGAAFCSLLEKMCTRCNTHTQCACIMVVVLSVPSLDAAARK